MYSKESDLTRPEAMMKERGLENENAMTVKITAAMVGNSATGGLAAIRNVMGKSNAERNNATFRFSEAFVERHEEELGKIIDRINRGLSTMRGYVRGLLTEEDQRNGEEIAIQRAVLNELDVVLVQNSPYTMEEVKFEMITRGWMKTDSSKKLELDVSLGFISDKEFAFSKARSINGVARYTKNADLPGGRFVPTNTPETFEAGNRIIEKMEEIYKNTIDIMPVSTDEESYEALSVFANALPEGQVDVYEMSPESRLVVDQRVRTIVEAMKNL